MVKNFQNFMCFRMFLVELKKYNNNSLGDGLSFFSVHKLSQEIYTFA